MTRATFTLRGVYCWIVLFYKVAHVMGVGTLFYLKKKPANIAPLVNKIDEQQASCILTPTHFKELLYQETGKH